MKDFLVIGGGVGGISAAARLADLGSVTLLEMEDALGYHASGRSAALFEENYGKPSTIELNRASRAHHETHRGGVLSPRGLLLVGTADKADMFASDVTTMKLDEITVDAARDMVPILSAHVDRAAYHGDAHDIDTDLLIQNYARDLRDAGGEVVLKRSVTAITRITGGWQVTAGTDVYEARTLVNAAGAWVDGIAAMAGVHSPGFRPLRRSMARIPAPGGHDVSGWPMIFGPGEDWYAKPDAGALLVSPADEDPADPHDAWADDMVLAEGIARYQEHVTEEVTRLISSWAGLRTFSPDGELVLGPDPAQADFIWVAGQGGYGMQSSPAAARLVADLVAGRSPELPADAVARLSPARFT